MRICHVTTVHPAKDARIFYRMCRGIARKRIPVTLIAPEEFTEESFLRPSTWNARLARAGRLKRIALALKGALAERADLYHFHDPELIGMGLMLKALRPSRAVVYDVHEDYPSMMKDKYWLPNWTKPVAAGGVRAANAAAALFLDGIVTADPAVRDDFRTIGTGKSLVYYNFPDLSLFQSNLSKVTAPKADLVYIGGMSQRSGMFVLFEALTLLRQRGIRPSVRLAGYTDGPRGVAEIRDAALRGGLEQQIEFHGRIPHSQVPSWLRSGTIGLVLLQAVPKFMKNIPSKMFEYWACGLPVLASSLPPIRQFLSPGRNGLFFSPSSPESLADCIGFLLDNPDKRDEMGRAGQRMVEEHWNNGTQVDRLLRLYESLCDRSSPRLIPVGSRRRVRSADTSQVRDQPADS